MLNKIMMSGRLTTMPALTSEDDFQYCKFSIAVDQSKRRGADTVETDTFTCLAIDDNASAVNFLYSKGGQITFVGLSKKSARKSIFRIFFYGGSFFYGFLHLHYSKKDHFYPLDGIFMEKTGWKLLTKYRN